LATVSVMIAPAASAITSGSPVCCNRYIATEVAAIVK
jgi:hypothetical protein